MGSGNTRSEKKKAENRDRTKNENTKGNKIENREGTKNEKTKEAKYENTKGNYTRNESLGSENETGKEGSVFKERYHLHVLKTPKEVKNALEYVAFESIKTPKTH